jgi:hypothetical protein
MNSWKRSGLALIVLALMAAACAGSSETAAFQTISESLGGGSGGFTSGGDTSGVPREETAAPATTAAANVTPETAAPAADVDSTDGAVTPVVAQVDTGRDIIYVAEVTVAVTDVAAATAKATQAIQSLGGLIFGQQTTGTPPQSTLIFKILPEDFQTALDRLGSLGELRNQNITADDVTERVVDLQSRIATAEASVARLRELLLAAADIDNIVALENQLLQRETELETLRGQLRTLESQVAYATIYLTITEAASQPAIRVGVTTYPGHDEGAACPGTDGLVVDRDAEITYCFEIVNVGDTDLTDIALRDVILDIELDDLVPVLGNPEDTLEPGQSIVLAGELVAERRLKTQTNVTAVALDKDGNPLDRPVSNKNSIETMVVDPEGIPGFTDGIESSWRLLLDGGRWGILLVGVIIPFVWIPLLLWWLWRRRRQVGTAPVESTPEPVPTGIAADPSEG